MPGCSSPRAHGLHLSSILQASLSEQIRDVQKIITDSGSTPTPSVVAKEVTGEQRLVKLEETHQHILQMLDDLRRRVDQLEVNKQTMSGVRNARRKKTVLVVPIRHSHRYFVRGEALFTSDVKRDDLNRVPCRRSQLNQN